jgi:deferrochelatase/peroxidase EfeB
MAPPSSEWHDIQGLLRSAFSTLTEASFLLLRIVDSGAARAWLAAAPVTTANERRTVTALQVAITAEGMRTLGVPHCVISGFSAEFISGMTGNEGRSRRLGDIGENSPSTWRWGSECVPHVLVALYARDGRLDSWRAQIVTNPFLIGFQILEDLSTSNMHNKEPFGFIDGVSQPLADWDEIRMPGTLADLEYGNLIAPGEFLLGYRNEYGLYTDRPLLDPTFPDAGELPVAEDYPPRRDLGRNGSYLVMRELHQDVRSFWRFVTAQAGDPMAVAEAFVGRHRDGTPLVPGRHQLRGIGESPTEIARNGFTYDDDPDGRRCPFGAHIRRANPRTGDMPSGQQGWFARFIRTLGLGRPDLRQDLIASSRFHRILRRGREFGQYLPAEQAVAPDARDPQSGLHFLCLNANIARQFEFIQNAWLTTAKFARLSGESDPLLANRQPGPRGEATDGFTWPQANGVARRLAGVPQFVTVAGGAYFFLPGLRALRFLARTSERQ